MSALRVCLILCVLAGASVADFDAPVAQLNLDLPPEQVQHLCGPRGGCRIRSSRVRRVSESPGCFSFPPPHSAGSPSQRMFCTAMYVCHDMRPSPLPPACKGALWIVACAMACVPALLPPLLPQCRPGPLVMLYSLRFLAPPLPSSLTGLQQQLWEGDGLHLLPRPPVPPHSGGAHHG